MRLIAVLLTVALVGCAGTSRHVPPNVTALPNDCANRQALIEWLETQGSVPRQAFESEKHYEQTRSQIRHRIWHVRYNCQPV